MPREEAPRAAAGLAKQLIHPPDPDGIVPVKGKGGAVGAVSRPPQVAGRGRKPGGRVPQQAVEALQHPGRQGEAKLVQEGARGVIGGEGQNAVLIQNDAEPSVHCLGIPGKGAEFILKNRLVPISGNQARRPLSHLSVLNQS